MDDMLLICLTSGENVKIDIKIHKDASVDELMTKITEWCKLEKGNYRVLYEAKELQNEKGGKRMYLSDYKVRDRAQMYQLVKFGGGINPDQQENPAPKQLPDDAELSDHKDMISWDDDPARPRAKMPCGHAIGPESLTEYCKSLLDDGKCQFHCPYIDDKSRKCGQVWEYFVVRRLGVLTEDEMDECEIKLTQNYLRKSDGMQACPKCTVFGTRRNRKDKRVICSWCSKDGKKYEFCWCCRGEWKTNGTTSCGNTACTGKDPRLTALEEAPRINIVGVNGCPSIRACPKCGILIEHISACKHMVCRCSQKFCFICLKKADTHGRYQCGSYNSPCNIAPIQKQILGADADDDAPGAPATPAQSAAPVAPAVHAAPALGSAHSTESWCTVM